MDAHAYDRVAEPASILVVDDEAFVRRIVGRLLVRAGYRVALAGDGGDALTVLSGSAAGFDLVLSDIHMPGMNGPELMTRARRVHPELAFVFMTGAHGASHPSAPGHGSATLIKPFGWAELEGAVEAALAARGAASVTHTAAPVTAGRSGRSDGPAERRETT